MPRRGNGTPYRGINVLLLWGEAMDKGYTCNTWMTYKQAEERGAQVRKGEKGSMVVYADRASTTETNDKVEEVERAFAFMKAYTVFNVQQIDGLPESFYAKLEVREEGQLLERLKASLGRPAQRSATAATAPSTPRAVTSSSCRRCRPFATPKATRPPRRMSLFTGQATRPVWRGPLASALVIRPMRSKSWLPSWDLLFSLRCSASRRSHATIMPPIWRTGSRS